jgi:hypothetical protein
MTMIVRGFVVATGQIVQHRLSPPELNTLDQVASSVARKGISNITLRCNLDPEIHPTLSEEDNSGVKGVRRY